MYNLGLGRDSRTVHPELETELGFRGSEGVRTLPPSISFIPSFFFFNVYFYLFVYLAAQGLSCGTQNLSFAAWGTFSCDMPALTCGMWESSFLTRDQTRTPYIVIAGSKPLGTSGKSLLSCFLLSGHGLLLLPIWGTFTASVVWAWSPSYLIPMHCVLPSNQATPLMCFTCIVFIFMSLKSVYFSSPQTLCLRSPHVVSCVLCVCSTCENSVLRPPPSTRFLPLPPCHSVPLWFWNPMSGLPCAVSSKRHIPSPLL